MCSVLSAARARSRWNHALATTNAARHKSNHSRTIKVTRPNGTPAGYYGMNHADSAHDAALMASFSTTNPVSIRTCTSEERTSELLKLRKFIFANATGDVKATWVGLANEHPDHNDLALQQLYNRYVQVEGDPRGTRTLGTWRAELDNTLASMYSDKFKEFGSPEAAILADEQVRSLQLRHVKRPVYSMSTYLSTSKSSQDTDLGSQLNRTDRPIAKGDALRALNLQESEIVDAVGSQEFSQCTSTAITRNNIVNGQRMKKDEKPEFVCNYHTTVAGESACNRVESHIIHKTHKDMDVTSTSSLSGAGRWNFRSTPVLKGCVTTVVLYQDQMEAAEDPTLTKANNHLVLKYLSLRIE